MVFFIFFNTIDRNANRTCRGSYAKVSESVSMYLCIQCIILCKKFQMKQQKNIQFRKILTLIVFVMVLALAWYINSWSAVLMVVSDVLIIGALVFSIRYIWCRIRNKTLPEWHHFWWRWTARINLFAILIVAGLTTFVWYYTHSSPATLPQYTLSNGERTLIFQSMSHIATSQFYDQVAQQIRDVQEQGGVYYYE